MPSCTRAWSAGLLVFGLTGCTVAAKDQAVAPDFRASAAVKAVKNADLSPRFPSNSSSQTGTETESQLAPQPMLFPGSAPDPASPPKPSGGTQVASLDPGATVSGDDVQMNFEGADIQTVAKTLLGDILKLNYVVDPRVQGRITLGSAGTIPRKDVLPAFEAMLQMSNAAIVQDGKLVKIVPMTDAGGKPLVEAGEAGFGVSILRPRTTSVASVARTVETFLTRPGAVRVDAARNLLLIQGTTSERQAAVEIAAALDADWLHHQSVGVYPIKSTSPEIIIQELERLFQSAEGGLGQGLVRFQPISRMNAVMVVTQDPELLERATQWVRRLDRADNSGTTLRTYRLKHGNATQVAKILTDIFGQRSAGSDTSAGQVAPGLEVGKSKLDVIDASINSASTMSKSSAGVQKTAATKITTISPSLSDSGGADDESSSGTPPGFFSAPAARPLFQNLRITADAANNAIVVYSNLEDYRLIERSVRELDQPRQQVAIEAVVAEVGLTDTLKYGVQFFLTNNRGTKGSIGLVNAPQSAAQRSLLGGVVPGFNLLFGSETNPRVILNALTDVTNVKVLSSPSIVVVDNQPAMLQVGDEVPITTSSATLLSNSTNPVVNTIEMRNTGVILKVLPHVHADGAIQLEIDQEISNVVDSDQQSLTPTISQRRVHSTVSVTNGQTVLLGGLISEREQNTRDGIPGVREIRFVGDVLGSTQNSKLRSEIIMFIRPQLIRSSFDARHVAEEFREKLLLMRGDAGPASAASIRAHGRGVK